MVSFFNNEFVQADKTLLHVNDLAIQRGYGIFEFFKVRKGIPLFFDDYLDRFYRSAEVMQLPVPFERSEMKKVVYQLLERNNASDCGVKFILTGGYSDDAYTISKPNFIMQQYELKLSDSITAGIKIITHEHVREIPHVKSINYITGIQTLQKMKQQGAADVLYHNRGVVSEFPRCNFFIVTSDNVIRTAANNVLHGITRKNILKIAANHYKVDAGTITLDDVYQAKEAFLTSTTKRIIPITQVEDKLVGDGRVGEVSKKLYSELVNLENSYLQIAVK